jgi:penicillin-binding protein 2
VFDVSGTQKLRFLADVYGEVYTSGLTEEQRNATPWDIIEFLAGNKGNTSFAIGDYKIEGDKKSGFVVGKGYTKEELLKMVNIRYAMRLTSFRKYVGTVVAKDISDETVAVILENN